MHTSEFLQTTVAGAFGLIKKALEETNWFELEPGRRTVVVTDDSLSVLYAGDRPSRFQYRVLTGPSRPLIWLSASTGQGTHTDTRELREGEEFTYEDVTEEEIVLDFVDAYQGVEALVSQGRPVAPDKAAPQTTA